MDSPRPVPIETLLVHRGFVRALARRLAADDAGADDVEQSAWLAALRRPPRHALGLRAWLARLVRQRAADARRAEGRRALHEAAAGSARAVASPDETAARMDSVARVVAAVARLPEPYRTTIVLRFYDDLSVAEIAARMDAPPATVRTRLTRAYVRLREELGITDESRDEWIALIAPWPAARRWIPIGAAGAAGAIAMSMKTWAAAAAVLAVLGGAIWWRASSAPSSPIVPPVAHHEVAAAPRSPAPAAIAPSAPVDAGNAAASTACEVVVEVRSLRDTAISGAEIRVRSYRDSRGPAVAVATTYADGCANVAPGAGEWLIDVRADGYADGSALVRCAPADARRRVIVRLGRGFALRGTVRDESGALFEGAVVCCGERRATTGADGVYVLSGIPAGELRVSVRAPGRFAPAPGVVAIPDVASYDFRLVALTMETATGVVLDDATSAPIDGAVVSPAVNGWNEVPSDTTGADGRFRIDGLMKGFSKALVVAKPGYVQFPARRVDRADGVELRLRRGPTVRGVVSSSDGPVADAEVNLASPSPYTAIVRRTVRTNAAGAFAFDGVPAGRSDLVVVAPGYCGPPFRHVDVPETGDVRVDVALVRGAVVAGRVVDDTGAAVDDAAVLSGGMTAWTDGTGAFRIEGVKPGASVPLLVISERYARIEAAIAVAEGTNEGVVLRVARTATVRGRVVADDGRSVEDARVFVVAAPRGAVIRDPMRDGGEERAGPFAVLADGSFDGFAPPSTVASMRAVVRSASHATSESETFDLVPGQTEYRADVVVRAGATIRGRVACDGRGIAGAAISLGRAGFGYSEPPVRATTDEAGAFTIEHVALPREGLVHVAVTADGFADAETDTSGDSPVELALERPLDIAGIVETADHAPLEGVHVAVVATDDAGPIPRTRFAFTDEHGRFRVRGLRPGSYRVTATMPPASKTAEGVAAGARDVVITFPH